MTRIATFHTEKWNQSPDRATQRQAIEALESGRVLFFPNMPFQLQDHEYAFLTPSIAQPKRKNVSYNLNTNAISGVVGNNRTQQELRLMMNRFARKSQEFIENLLPNYTGKMEHARTSYRPVQVQGRQSSYRKDDTRLHVDAFPSTPMKGKRILRVFSNINPDEPRVWRLGAEFSKVAEKFLPQVPEPNQLMARLLKTLKITRGMRTKYDHYMLMMHNLMKADTVYQTTVEQEEFQFPTGSTWMVYTDQVSHAAMSGQYVLEQSFYVPVSAMADQTRAPLRVLENSLGCALL